MNKTAIKNFAIWARNKLITDISYRAGLIGITEKGIADALPQSTGDTRFYDIGAAEPYSISGEAVRQREKLVEVIRQKEKDTDYTTAYQYIIEEVAYTWFNRLIAVRFMEVNDYLPSHMRVLSSESGKLEPDLVTNPFDADLPFTEVEVQRILQLKLDNQLDEVFRILFIKQCNALNEILPSLFEKTKNYTELLLNLSIIDQDGVVYHLVHDIPEDDFNIGRGGQVEIIGWLYQYYNTEPKAAAFAKKGKITKEEIPAVTQLFTPDWIVRYMVENSLGRLWVEGHPDCALKENWKYYLEEAEQEPEVQEQLTEIRREYALLNPEDIKIIDPCMGSGHILVYAFDVLMQIYESAGYSQRDAAKSILEHNIYGLDIDDRAYQLAYFAVMMKARQYNRRILNGENTCYVYAIQESNHINRSHLNYLGMGMDEMEREKAKLQLEGFLDTMTDAKEYGSILNVENYDWELLRRFVAAADTDGQVTFDSWGVEDTVEKLKQLVEIGETMARKYHTVCTNPPYMSVSSAQIKLYKYVCKHYESGKNDLYSVFIEKCKNYTKEGFFQAMITQQAWMFTAIYEKLRQQLAEVSIVSDLQLGANAFEEIKGEVVQTATFIIRNIGVKDYLGCYMDLTSGESELSKEKMFWSKNNIFYTKYNDFKGVPNESMAYWLSHDALVCFGNKKLSEDAITREGMTTADNERFLRCWYEVGRCNIGIGCKQLEEIKLLHKKWFPYNKGGANRKWYGNRELVVNWENDGREIKSLKDEKTGRIRSHNYNAEYSFRECGTWTAICSGNIMVRYSPVGSLFDSKGASVFASNDGSLKYIIAMLNSKVSGVFLKVLSPAYEYKVGHVANVPLIYGSEEMVQGLSSDNISLSKGDWDSFETSWDFKKHPLLQKVSTIFEAFAQWQAECDERFNRLKANEEELNRIFIDIYGLQDELTPKVEDKDVTVRKADLQRDVKSLLSYAVGCMFGRYSLDTEGLAYAGGEWDCSKYQTFIPDADNVIPITDEEYLEDDMVGRLCTWLKAVYGESTLEENIDFIAKALGNKGDSSRQIIRNYFLNDFFKDHCQTYSVTGSGKRPIYWLFDSGKQNGFKALVYLHRYTPDTIGNLRVDYLHRMQRVYESEMERMQDMIDHSTSAREIAASTKRKDKLAKQLKECREYDEKIGHLALSRTELDLDDGVKVNYRKLQTAYDGNFYEVLADSKNIMVKEKK